MTSPSKTLDRRICVAPMMDYTDRHFRFLLRLLSPRALLYTEMINAHAIVRGDAHRLLSFDANEHPVALQLGGSEPELLAEAARVGADFGYDEVNLNCGCPSDRVQSGRFGACLMDEPDRVAESVAAMSAAASVPITVKTRIGIEPRKSDTDDEYQYLHRFIATVASAGCSAFVVHARKAILSGLSPKQNREIPPLRFDVAEQLRRDFPQLTLVVNGGIRTLEQVRAHLGQFDGVMLGREICDNPYRLAELHREHFASDWRPAREAVIERYCEYMHERWTQGERLQSMLRHALMLFAGQPRARSWRRFISERATRATTTPDVVREALRIVSSEGRGPDVAPGRRVARQFA